MGHFHTRSLENGLRFPLSDFIIEVLNDYRVAPSQLAPNTWRILGAFFLGYRKKEITATNRQFKQFYYLKSGEEFYFFQSRDSPIVTDLLECNKGWKRIFIQVTNPNGFRVSLRWKTTDASGNRAPDVMPEEQGDFDKLLKSKFPWKLVLDEREIIAIGQKMIPSTSIPQQLLQTTPNL